MNKIIKNALILTIITLVAGLGLGFVYEITKDPIAQAHPFPWPHRRRTATGRGRCP